jgi:hypothetical protein
MKARILFLALAMASPALAQDPPVDSCPAPSKCVTAEQKQKILQAMDELDDIHKSPAVVTLQDPIVIVRDWQDRVYVNGGTNVPIRAKLKIGKHVDRDLAIALKPQLWYRDKPPDLMFRLRIRAQAGILVPQIFQADTGWNRYDAGLSWDFFHLGIFNFSAYTGIRSAGGGPGIDLTKNFGLYGGYAVVYDGWKHSALISAYFSFN